MKKIFLLFAVVILIFSCSGVNQRQKYEKINEESQRIIIKINNQEQIELNDVQYEDLIFTKSLNRSKQLLKVYLTENNFLFNETDFETYCRENYKRENFEKIKEYESDNSGFIISEFKIQHPDKFFKKIKTEQKDAANE